MKKTPWFNAQRKHPARVGFYEAKYQDASEPLMRYWNGVTWLDEDKTFTLFADKNYPGDKWRGLSEEPK